MTRGLVHCRVVQLGLAPTSFSDSGVWENDESRPYSATDLKRFEALGIEPLVDGCVGQGSFELPASLLRHPAPANKFDPVKVVAGQCTARHAVRFHWWVWTLRRRCRHITCVSCHDPNPLPASLSNYLFLALSVYLSLIGAAL